MVKVRVQPFFWNTVALHCGGRKGAALRRYHQYGTQPKARGQVKGVNDQKSLKYVRCKHWGVTDKQGQPRGFTKPQRGAFVNSPWSLLSQGRSKRIEDHKSRPASLVNKAGGKVH